jgi:sulfur-carrier protein
MACSELTLTSDQPETVSALMEKIFLPDGRSLASYAETESLMLAVNQKMVEGDARLEANDEVAFFPPVTGG